jgi:putative ABC transport system permease protein
MDQATCFGSLYNDTEEDLASHYPADICSAVRRDTMKQRRDDDIWNNHILKPADDADYNIRSQEEVSSMMTSTSDMLTILLACIAGISLIVGGIGIMNIMYVSVTERTREIGLRMSVGAKGRDILAQFLIEAILISVTGGIIGVILGLLCSLGVNVFLAWPIFIQPYSVLLSFAVCTITGVFFGWYPARKASDLDPIEAIRYE